MESSLISYRKSESAISNPFIIGVWLDYFEFQHGHQRDQIIAERLIFIWFVCFFGVFFSLQLNPM